ncbi:MAG: succinate dehydrogenase, cytochrome b556 subunit [Bdellovibrionales bacterium]
MSTHSQETTKRPLSPHLQVYKLPYNAIMSITGRAIGIALAIALSVILVWFSASVWNPEIYTTTIEFLNQPIIKQIMTYKLLLGAFAVFFYLGNGVRHVLWDLVIGVNVKFGILTGHITLAIAAILTIGLWAIITF